MIRSHNTARNNESKNFLFLFSLNAINKSFPLFQACVTLLIGYADLKCLLLCISLD